MYACPSSTCSFDDLLRSCRPPPLSLSLISPCVCLFFDLFEHSPCSVPFAVLSFPLVAMQIAATESLSFHSAQGAMETFFSSCPCPLARTTFPLVPLSPAEQQVVSQLKGRDFFDASTDSNELEGVLQSLRCAEEAAAAAGWRLYRPEQLTLLAQHKCILGRSKSDRSCVIQ